MAQIACGELVTDFREEERYDGDFVKRSGARIRAVGVASLQEGFYFSRDGAGPCME
jgi:hypothetical protein